MNNMDFKENKIKERMSIDEAAVILSDTLQDVAQRKTSLRRAIVVSRLALALSKIIEIADLKQRVVFLEQSLKKRK
jgi:hypothetical protein